MTADRIDGDPVPQHVCYAHYCNRVAFRLFCRMHLAMVPATLRAPLLTHWVPALGAAGQNPEFQSVLSRACQLIAAREGRR